LPERRKTIGNVAWSEKAINTLILSWLSSLAVDVTVIALAAVRFRRQPPSSLWSL
jgi:hypothetical protein